MAEMVVTTAAFYRPDALPVTL